MGRLLETEEIALESNMNQSMIFISYQNINFIPDELKKFAAINPDRLAFSRRLLSLLKKYAHLGDGETLTPKLEMKLNSLKKVVKKIKLD
jgi:hypothetical protein